MAVDNPRDESCRALAENQVLLVVLAARRNENSDTFSYRLYKDAEAYRRNVAHEGVADGVCFALITHEDGAEPSYFNEPMAEGSLPMHSKLGELVPELPANIPEAAIIEQAPQLRKTVEDAHIETRDRIGARVARLRSELGSPKAE